MYRTHPNIILVIIYELNPAQITHWIGELFVTWKQYFNTDIFENNDNFVCAHDKFVHMPTFLVADWQALNRDDKWGFANFDFLRSKIVGF